MKLLGGRVASVVIGLFALGIGSSASAQNMSALGNISAAVKAVDSAVATKSVAASTIAAAPAVHAAIATTTVVPASNGTIAQAQPVQAVSAKLASSIATEAAWLYKAGWPLYALVDKYSTGAALDEQANCLATAVYFEARGESLEGQLAVARVVVNRASSGRYPPDWCSVVKQPAQFSFVRHGVFPYVDTGSASWGKAQAIARLAIANVVPSVDPDVLWYHATYVAPSWGQRLNMVEKIGLHLFYRA